MAANPKVLAAERLGLTRQAIYARLKHGYTEEEALTMPPYKSRATSKRGRKRLPPVYDWAKVATGAVYQLSLEDDLGGAPYNRIVASGTRHASDKGLRFHLRHLDGVVLVQFTRG